MARLRQYSQGHLSHWDENTIVSIGQSLCFWPDADQKNIALHQKMTRLALPNETGWWFQTFFMFHFIYGMSSFPLTFTPSFFRGVGQPPTRRTGKHSSNQPQKKSLRPDDYWARWVPFGQGGCWCLAPTFFCSVLLGYVLESKWTRKPMETNGNPSIFLGFSRCCIFG